MRFDDARKASVKYLESNEFKEREDAEDSQKDLPFLIQMNKHGFLTNNSQPGNEARGKSPMTGKPYHIEERAYVSGFMKTKEGIEFVKKFNANSDKTCFINQVIDEDCAPVNTDYWLPLTVSNGEAFTRSSLWIPTQTFDFMKKIAKINKSESVVYIMCFDPLWNRKGISKKGLFHDILKAL